MNLKIKHDQTERVLEVLKKHIDGINGKIFHLRKTHWVALVKVLGSDEAIYFDDMVMIYMKNYEGSLAVLNMLETMSSQEYSKVFPAQICPPVLSVPPQSESERKKECLGSKRSKNIYKLLRFVIEDGGKCGIELTSTTTTDFL